MKRMVWAIIFCIFLFPFTASQAQAAAQISNIQFSPALDISNFVPYTISADISGIGSTSPVNISVKGVNGQGGLNWGYYIDGTPVSNSYTFPMSFVSGTTWQKTTVYPDYIYPDIVFAPSSVTWNHVPENSTIRRTQYHLFHFNNPFTMTGDMNFWVEVDALPNSVQNSADLSVYLVEKNTPLSFFHSNWLSKPGVERVSSISRFATFHHVHNANSGHYLVTLTPNNDGTVGTNHLNVSGDFWVVLYSTSPSNTLGWHLRYQASEYCNYTNRWYLGDGENWQTEAGEGCPDSHVHMLRRSGGVTDAVSVTIDAGSTSVTQEFSYNPLPNLPPTTTRFTNPNGGSVSDTLNITWDQSTDPNGDSIYYKLYLLDPNGNEVRTLTLNTGSTSFNFDTTAVADGFYGLKGFACDAQYCVQFNTDSNFYINNTVTQIKNLTSISISSTNSNHSRAITGDNVTISFTSSAPIATPVVSIFADGMPVVNSVSTQNAVGNIWESTFTANSLDANGPVSFEIFSTDLDQVYFSTTDSSSVVIDNPPPSPTPTMSPTPTLTLVPTQSPNISNSNNPPQTIASAPGCNDQKPQGAPVLFQIKSTSTSAKLYISPINQNITGYYISYGLKPDKYIYGTVQKSKPSSGVISFDINFLKPNTTYYYRVRGQNGCMPGDWGNQLGSRTLLQSRNVKTTTKSTLKTNQTPKPKTIVSRPTPASVVVPTPTKILRKLEKHCLLWWCWNDRDDTEKDD